MPIYLVGTCGSEIGMFGVKYLVQSYTLNPKYVVVGAPTDLKLVPAHKGNLVAKIAVGYHVVDRDARGFNRKIRLKGFGRVSHGAFPDAGVNALEETLRFLAKATESGFEIQISSLKGGHAFNQVPDEAVVEFYLTTHQFEDFKRFFRETSKNTALAGKAVFEVEFGGLGDVGISFLPEMVFPCLLDIHKALCDHVIEFAEFKNEEFFPPHCTMNLSMIEQSFGRMGLIIDFQLLNEVSVQEFFDKLQRRLTGVSNKYPALNISISKDRVCPGMKAEQGGFIDVCKSALEQADIPPTLSPTALCTEAGQFLAKGYDVVTFGPGPARGNVQSPNEHNLLTQMERATAFYEKLIERICL
jgi:acetylornithine deacetylase/succinyl-diaminopimelate desuccinylase-like protein